MGMENFIQLEKKDSDLQDLISSKPISKNSLSQINLNTILDKIKNSNFSIKIIQCFLNSMSKIYLKKLKKITNEILSLTENLSFKEKTEKKVKKKHLKKEIENVDINSVVLRDENIESNNFESLVDFNENSFDNEISQISINESKIRNTTENKRRKILDEEIE